MVTVALKELGPAESATITVEVIALGRERINNVTTATTPGGENTAAADLDVVSPPEEEEFVPEAGSLILLGGGLLTLAGYARVRWRKP